MSGGDSALPDWARLSLCIVLAVGDGYLLAAGAATLAGRPRLLRPLARCVAS